MRAVDVAARGAPDSAYTVPAHASSSNSRKSPTARSSSLRGRSGGGGGGGQSSSSGVRGSPPLWWRGGRPADVIGAAQPSPIPVHFNRLLLDPTHPPASRAWRLSGCSTPDRPRCRCGSRCVRGGSSSTCAASSGSNASHPVRLLHFVLLEHGLGHDIRVAGHEEDVVQRQIAVGRGLRGRGTRARCSRRASGSRRAARDAARRCAGARCRDTPRSPTASW